MSEIFNQRNTSYIQCQYNIEMRTAAKQSRPFCVPTESVAYLKSRLSISPNFHTNQAPIHVVFCVGGLV